MAVLVEFKLNDGYFILLDKLSSTLKEHIDEWKRVRMRTSSNAVLEEITTDQIDVVHSIASAISYLHLKNIVFRHLKPVRDK